MSETAALRREARRQRILQNAESRLHRLTTKTKRTKEERQTETQKATTAAHGYLHQTGTTAQHVNTRSIPEASEEDSLLWLSCTLPFRDPRQRLLVLVIIAVFGRVMAPPVFDFIDYAPFPLAMVAIHFSLVSIFVSRMTEETPSSRLSAVLALSGLPQGVAQNTGVVLGAFLRVKLEFMAFFFVFMLWHSFFDWMSSVA